MEKWFEASTTSIFAIAITCFVIYFLVFLFTRIVGKRSFAKMSSLDFAVTIAIGSVIASTIILKNVSLVQGGFALLLLYFIQWIASKLRRIEALKKMLDNTSLLLMDKSEILHHNLKKANVTEDDLKAKLREANVLNLAEVRAVVFESTGDISVLHTNDANKELEDWLLTDVTR